MWYNTATDALSRVNKCLSACEVKAILNETAISCQDRADMTLLTTQWDEEEE